MNNLNSQAQYVSVCLPKEDKKLVGCLYPSSNFDHLPYVKILDSFKQYPLLEDFFDELMESGLREATDGRNSQWGTWKFAIRSSKEAQIVIGLYQKVFGFNEDNFVKTLGSI